VDPAEESLVVGRNDVQNPNSDQPMESIRPQDIYDALLIRPIDSEHDVAVLENGYEILHDAKGHRVLQADYELVVIRKGAAGWFLSRKIVFSPHRPAAPSAVYLRRAGQPGDRMRATPITKTMMASASPRALELFRPHEEYDITLNMLKLEINKPLRDDQFALEQPPGAEVVHLDKPQSSAVVPLPGYQK